MYYKELFVLLILCNGYKMNINNILAMLEYELKGKKIFDMYDPKYGIKCVLENLLFKNLIKINKDCAYTLTKKGLEYLHDNKVIDFIYRYKKICDNLYNKSHI